jgi:hypothetical protein
MCPNENEAKDRMITNESIFLYPSLPVPTATVQTLSISMQTIFQLQNGLEKRKPSDGRTAKPAVHVSVSDKVHLCNTPTYRKTVLYAFSCVSAMAALF